MADISKITLPNGSSYNFKDATARSGLAGKAAASHTHTKSQITDFPTIPTKTSQLTNDSGFKTTDNNTTYSLSKSGSTITLTGSDGSKTSVTDNNTTYSTMTGATSSAAGKTGLVPAPATGAANRYLRSDGTWQVPPDNNTTYGVVSKTANGLVPKLPNETTTTKYLRQDGTWVVPPNTVYTHPTTSGNKHIPAGGSSGQILRWSADGTAVWGNDNNTTYNDATTSTHGLMSVSDKKALDVLKSPYATCATGRATADKVAALANFTLTAGATIIVKFTDRNDTDNPTSGILSLNVNNTGAHHIVVPSFDEAGERLLRYYDGATFCNNNTHIFTYNGSSWQCIDWYPVATTSASGFMSASDKAKLNDIATGANKTVVDSALSSTSTNPVQNKVVYSALASKAASSHNQASNTITAMTGYSKPSSTSAIATGDSLNTAIGKLEKALDSKQSSGSYAASSHTHSEYALKSKYGDTTINVGRKANTTVGAYSTAEGYNTTASGNYSHAEGFATASGTNSHAEGYGTTASGADSHAEGGDTTASGMESHAEGYGTTASGDYSHAGGRYTKAPHDNEVAYGIYNLSNNDTLFSIGDGTADDARHNAFEITATGGMLHDKDILTSAHCIQFIPYNMKYYAQEDRLLLFSNDDTVARGIYFVNNTPNDIVVCALISATGSGPTVQYGYGTNTYPDIQNTGEGREWFSEESIQAHPTIYTMTVPTGKRGYYGVYHNSETVYTTIHDIRCPYFNYF